MPFLLNTKKHYKIWFSDDPNRFLGIEDQLRFIRAREKNPGVEWSFIYSSKKLSVDSQKALKQFGQTYQITPLDFDTELPGLLNDGLDKKIYDIARDELTQPGGSLASASDLVRLLIPVIERGGIYSDFDLEVNFDKAPPIVPVKYPVVLPAVVTDATTAGINIDFLAVAHDSVNEHKIHAEAEKQIRTVQKTIIRKYTNPLEGFFTPNIRGFNCVLEQAPAFRLILNEFFTTYPSATIFSVRKYFSDGKGIISFPIPGTSQRYSLSPKESVDCRNSIIYQSIIDFSGSNSYYAIYDDYVPQTGFRMALYPQGVIVLPVNAWNQYQSSMKKSGLEENNLANYVDSKNLTSIQCTEEQSIDAGIRDGSWRPLGKQKKQEREQTIFSAGHTFLRLFKRHQNHKKTTGTGQVMAIAIRSISDPHLKHPSHLSREIKNELIPSETAFMPSI